MRFLNSAAAQAFAHARLGVEIVLQQREKRMQDRKRILVVDDDESLLRSLGRLLRQHSFEPVLFSSAKDFATRAEFEDACCILLDINLQDSSGIELRDRLAQAGITTPVIFMTGNTDECTREKALGVGCFKYLTKPFLARELLDLLKALCGPTERGWPTE
jgi:FixJ family two-component response regulator